MKTAIVHCRYHLALSRHVILRLDDAHRAAQPRPGSKTAGWLIGHLAVTGDFARHLCGGKALCPREWRAAFNPGTTPSTDPSSYPSMHELCETFRAVYADLCETAATADPARLSVSNPYVPTREDFPTAGEFVAYLMSSHLAYHLGQLTEWCAAAGVAREPVAAV
jgi:hypothetical protein